MTLDTAPRIADPDGFFEALMEAHRGLTAEASRALDARLVLILANQVGDMAVLRAAIAAAKAAGTPVSDAGRRPSPPPAG
jgi:hypothetical protein